MKTKKSKKTATSLRKRHSRRINSQRHATSCGPIAVANAIKWARVETSYAEVLRFCVGIRAYHPRKGMFPYQMRYLLRTLKMKFKVKRFITCREIDAIVGNGGSLILIYDSKKRGSHAVFIDGVKDRGYRVWNKIKGLGPWYPKEIIRDDIKRSVRHIGHLYAYIFQPLRPLKK